VYKTKATQFPKLLIILTVWGNFQSAFSQVPEVGIWDRFEVVIHNSSPYEDPLRDVGLTVYLKVGRHTFEHYGFYDGDSTWRIRIMPWIIGRWSYQAVFSDSSRVSEGRFRTVESDLPGLVHKDHMNPLWFGTKRSGHRLIRSFHVGDKFFATNWDDPADKNDGELRTVFLDWLQQQGYNSLSVASLFIKRDSEGRGAGWDVPRLWPLNPGEYRKMELILDDLWERGITVFPFAGFFGKSGYWPTQYEEQAFYLKYILARFGYYSNMVFSVAGPEPLFIKGKGTYQESMKGGDINRLGRLIADLDVHDHLLTVHNEKDAHLYGSPFTFQEWCDFTTLQGPTTTSTQELYRDLVRNHHRSEPLYAQETLWAGNKWHPEYTDEQLRKNAIVIMMSASALNFADMAGNSSTGFSGTLALNDRNQRKHDIIRSVWDFFESLDYFKFSIKSHLIEGAYLLADEGKEYLVYADTAKSFLLRLGEHPLYKADWISASDFTVRQSLVIKGNPQGGYRDLPRFTKPDDQDWLLHIYTPKPSVVASGNFPDIQMDHNGDLHLVYHKSGQMYYRRYMANEERWAKEQATGCQCENVKRSEPDIAVDSEGNPGVYCGKEFAKWDGTRWVKSLPGTVRDTELVVDGEDNFFVCTRGGNNGGNIGVFMLKKGSQKWVPVTDPDRYHHIEGKDHVYPDMYVSPVDNNLHLVQRQGKAKNIVHWVSPDYGRSWTGSGISDEHGESPHIIVDYHNQVFVSTAKGEIFKKTDSGWVSEGKVISSVGRWQPELAIDKSGVIYCASYLGQYSIRKEGFWSPQQYVVPVTDRSKVGFVEIAGAEDHAYIAWEEGSGEAETGLDEGSVIVVGKIFHDGLITSLNYPDKL